MSDLAILLENSVKSKLTRPLLTRSYQKFLVMTEFNGQVHARTIRACFLRGSQDKKALCSNQEPHLNSFADICL